jgi:hypothetical protein
MRDLDHIRAFAGGIVRRDWSAVHEAERRRLAHRLARMSVAESYEELRRLYEAWGGPPPPDLAPLEAEASAERISAIQRRSELFRCAPRAAR